MFLYHVHIVSHTTSRDKLCWSGQTITYKYPLQSAISPKTRCIICTKVVGRLIAFLLARLISLFQSSTKVIAVYFVDGTDGSHSLLVGNEYNQWAAHSCTALSVWELLELNSSRQAESTPSGFWLATRTSWKSSWMSENVTHHSLWSALKTAVFLQLLYRVSG